MVTQDITIIYPPALDYNFMHQRPQQLMKAFAQAGANVIYINPANKFPDVEDVVRPFIDTPRFTVVKKGVPYEKYVKGKVVLYCAVNQSKFIDETRHDLAVFDSCDLASDEFSVWKKHIPLLEQRVGLVCASSKIVYDDHVSRGMNTILVPNAADYNHFKEAVNRLQKPDDFPAHGNSLVVGYYGATYTWMDIGMLYAIADHFPVVVIGRNSSYKIPIDHRNITVLDMKKYKELPNYLSWFDAAIIPFKLTEMIKGCDPVKCYEYLSAGKPVISSDMIELHKFKEVVYFANTNDVVKVISNALRENSPQLINRRQEIAKENSWLSRAEYALEHIKKLL